MDLIKFLEHNPNKLDIVEYFNSRTTKLLEDEKKVILKFIHSREDIIKLVFIKYIGRVKDAETAKLLVPLLDSNLEKFNIKLAVIETLSEINKSEEFDKIFKKLLNKITKIDWKQRFLTKNVSYNDIVETFIELIKNNFQNNLKININDVKTRQLTKYITKDPFTIINSIQENFEGNFVFNIDSSVIKPLRLKIWESGLLKNYIVEDTIKKEDLKYIYFYDLFNFINYILSLFAKELAKKNIFIDVKLGQTFNSPNILLSESGDENILIDLDTEIGKMSFVFIFIKEKELDYNNIISKIKIYKEKDKIIAGISLLDINKKNKIDYNTEGIIFENSNINLEFNKVIGNKIILKKEIYKKLENYYQMYTSELKADRRETAQATAKINFFVNILNDLEVEEKNYIFYKLKHLNDKLYEIVKNKILYYKKIMDVDSITTRKIISKLSFADLVNICLHTEMQVKNKILINCSEKQQNDLIQEINSPQNIHPGLIVKSKHKLAKLIYNNYYNAYISDKTVDQLLEKLKKINI